METDYLYSLSLQELKELYRKVGHIVVQKTEENKNLRCEELTKYLSNKYFDNITYNNLKITNIKVEQNWISITFDNTLIKFYLDGILSFIKVLSNDNKTQNVYYYDNYLKTHPNHSELYYLCEKFNIIMEKLIPIFFHTDYVLNLPKAITFTLCNKHTRKFPSGIDKIISKYILF
jgi:hypothetical protein